MVIDHMRLIRVNMLALHLAEIVAFYSCGYKLSLLCVLASAYPYLCQNRYLWNGGV